MRRFLKAPHLTARLGLDAAMVLLFVTSLAFRATGREMHEWAGMAFCLLLAAHALWNWGWFRNLFTRKNTARRTINAVINLTLVAAMVVLCVCGILNSRHVFGFSQFFDGERIRQIHTIAAYWCLVLVGVHTGLYWGMVIGAVRKQSGFGGTRKAAVLLPRTLVVFTIGLGVWAFCERDMATKLFLGFSFDFWPPDWPLALFYACNLAIVGAYAFTVHYISISLKLFRRKAPLPFGKKCAGRQVYSGEIHEHIF